MLALFRSQEYGIRPEVPYEQTERLRSEEYLPKCKAIRQIWDICLKTKQGSLEFPVVLVRPEGTQKVPAVLFLCNHEKTASPGPKMGPDQMEKLLANAPEAWRKEAMNFFRNMPAGSGGPSLIDIEQETEQEYWPAEQIVQSGRAAVTFYASALQPDDAAQYPGPLAKAFWAQYRCTTCRCMGDRTSGIWGELCGRPAGKTPGHRPGPNLGGWFLARRQGGALVCGTG